MNKHRFTLRNSKGFTLLEVTLFLAVSAGLIVIAVAGLGPRIRNVRFTSAVKSLEGSISSNFLDAQQGINQRSAKYPCVKQASGYNIDIKQGATEPETGTTADCVVNGKVAVFEKNNNQVVFRSIVSLVEPANISACSALTGFDKYKSYQCYRSTIVSDAQEDPTIYKYPSDLKQTSDTRAVGYIINPDTGEKDIFNFKSGSGSYVSALHNGYFYSSNGGDLAVPSQPTSFCFTMSRRDVSFEFTPNNLTPQVTFNSGCSV